MYEIKIAISSLKCTSVLAPRVYVRIFGTFLSATFLVNYFVILSARFEELYRYAIYFCFGGVSQMHVLKIAMADLSLSLSVHATQS